MAMTLITTNTSSGASASSFTSSIDSTYKLFIFKFYDINPADGDGQNWQFQGSTDGGSSYGVTKTTTAFRAKHTEADAVTGPNYEAGLDLAQATGAVVINSGGTGADESMAGELFLFNPSNTTYVKHFYFESSTSTGSEFENHFFGSGYFNTTSAINAIQFTVGSGNFDAVVKMYGVG